MENIQKLMGAGAKKQLTLKDLEFFGISRDDILKLIYEKLKMKFENE